MQIKNVFILLAVILIRVPLLGQNFTYESNETGYYTDILQLKDSSLVVAYPDPTDYGISVIFFDKKGNRKSKLKIRHKTEAFYLYDLNINAEGNIWLAGYSIYQNDQSSISGTLIEISPCGEFLRYYSIEVEPQSGNSGTAITGILNIGKHSVIACMYADVANEKYNYITLLRLAKDTFESVGYVNNCDYFNHNNLDSQSYLFTCLNRKRASPNSNAGAYKAGYIEFDTSGKMTKEFVIDLYDSTRNTASAFVWKEKGITYTGNTDFSIGKTRNPNFSSSTLYGIDESKAKVVKQLVYTDTNYVDYFAFTGIKWRDYIVGATGWFTNDLTSKAEIPTLYFLNRTGDIVQRFRPGDGAKRPSFYRVDKLNKSYDNQLLVCGNVHRIDSKDRGYWTGFISIYDTALNLLLPDGKPEGSSCLKDTTIYVSPTKVFRPLAKDMNEPEHEIVNVNSGKWDFLMQVSKVKISSGLLYPNPSNGSFKVSLGSENIKDLRYEIYSMSGQLLQQGLIGQTGTLGEVQFQQKGMFVFRLIGDKKEAREIFKVDK